MSDRPVLEVARRDQTGSGPAGRVREEGFVPGVFYGTEVDSVPVSVDPDDLDSVMEAGNGANTVFELEVDEGPSYDYVILRDHQFDPVKRELTHVDLMVVEPDREIVMQVPVEPQGEAEGEELGGRLQVMHPEVPVRCTPTTVPESLPVDIEEMGPSDTMSASELEYPEGIEPEFKNDYAVLRIMMPRTGVVGLEPEGPEAEEEEEVEGEEAEEVEGEEPEEVEDEEEESEGADRPPGAAPPGA